MLVEKLSENQPLQVLNSSPLKVPPQPPQPQPPHQFATILRHGIPRIIVKSIESSVDAPSTSFKRHTYKENRYTQNSQGSKKLKKKKNEQKGKK